MSDAVALLLAVVVVVALVGAAGGIAGVLVAALLVRRELQSRLDKMRMEWRPNEPETSDEAEVAT